MKINLGSIQMPLNAATKAFAVLAKRGAGKTYSSAVMAEEFYKAGIPFVVFDPIDVWWGLRLAANGKDKGLPVVVFGLEHADVTLDRDMGRRIAQAVVRDNISAVISTFGMPKNAQRHLIAEFSEELLNINNTPRHIFIEEAHEFVPQKVFGGLGVAFNAVSNLVVMGRNRGIGVTLINQRAATLNKDVLTQVDTLVALRSVGPQDRKAIKEWVEFHAADEEAMDEFLSSLPSLPTGEAWVWSPEFLDTFEKIKIRKRETFHPDREKMGKFVMPHLDVIDVQSFIEKFNSEKPEKKGKKKDKETIVMPPPSMTAPVQADVMTYPEVIKMRNEFESQLVQKDVEIRRLSGIISNGIKALGGNGTANVIPAVSSGTIDFWIDKIGRNTSAGKILSFLNERQGMKMSRNQVRTAVGISAKSSGFPSALTLLRKNSLIVEQGADIMINPEL